jgi:hypothetical protein
MGWKSLWKGAKGIETPPVPEKPRARRKKGLAHLWNGKRIMRKVHAGRGQETKWEISIEKELL